MIISEAERQALAAELVADGAALDGELLDELQRYAERWEIGRAVAFCEMQGYAREWDRWCAEARANCVPTQ